MKYPKIKSGDKFRTNAGSDAIVTDIIDSKRVLIRFNDKYNHEAIVHSRELRNGEFKNPYHPSINKIGYFGVGIYKSSINKKETREYGAWARMIERCNKNNHETRYPTYAGCIIDQSWLNFQVFAEWYANQNKNKSWVLDKDILIKGNKIYSSGTCRLVPAEINALILSRSRFRGDLPIGVSRFRNKFQSLISVDGKRIRLGTFQAPDMAFTAYKVAKEENIKRMASLHKEELDSDIYDALMNYEVLITD